MTNNDDELDIISSTTLSLDNELENFSNNSYINNMQKKSKNCSPSFQIDDESNQETRKDKVQEVKTTAIVNNNKKR